ncbi:MAG: metallophosphoesterase [Marinilabiliaceae bacterium]|nr:metallophosphoesterase [Marinilabiliaceae bacterium]
MRFIIILLVFLTIIFGANFYVFYRFWHLIPTNQTIRIIIISVSIFLFISPFLSLGIADKFPTPIASFFYNIGTSWLIIMLYLVMIFFLFDIVRILGFLPVKQFMFNSLKGLGFLSIFMMILMTFGHFNYFNKKRVELTINTEKIGEPHVPLKIVAISDLHLGYGIGTKQFKKWVKLINAEQPDILLIAGDAIDNSLKPLYKNNYKEIFDEINTKYGIYITPGNHEYISNIHKSIDFFNKAGVTMLRDSVILIDNNYYIVGRDDRYNSKRKSISELTAEIDKSKPVILIDHQPFQLDEVAQNNIDLFFAGHTHDGQVFPISLITKLMFEISHGYLKKGNTHFYVSSGIGVWGGKFRIGTRSEYVVINFD